MKRNATSHKGENGVVAIIGGSAHMHGAPLLCALAAEASGTDLLYVCLPAPHAEAAKHASLNFQVHAFRGTELAQADVMPLTELLSTVDVAIIGPGLGREESVLDALQHVVGSCPCPMVLDATALQPQTLKSAEGKTAVFTPHQGELERMGIRAEDLPLARAEAWTFLVKGQTDCVYSNVGEPETIAGGNAGLTVGGTGDVLAGLVAGLYAQTRDAKQSAVLASQAVKRAGEMLYETHGFAYAARDVVNRLPHVLHVLTD